ncbi:MAG: hypothetical protein ACOYNN_10910 [Terrimicrobiaceae bacterium]
MKSRASIGIECRRIFCVSLSIVFLVILSIDPARASEPVSKYTSTATKDALSKKNFGGDPELDGSEERICPGFGGYQLVFKGDSDRSWIDVKFGKQISDLYAVSMQNAPGSFATKSNDTVEWRGWEVQGKFAPYAIIYRISGYNEETQTTKTRLLVFRLSFGKAEFVGHAEGAGEDAKAKKIADQSFSDAGE